MTLHTQEELRNLLQTARTIAVVGHSDKPHRTSYRIAQYLRQAGYTVYPVNPAVSEIDGQPSYPDLASVPEPIDIVDVFRRSEHLPAIVAEAIQAGAKAVWAQLGVEDAQAAAAAEAAGLPIVMDRCIMVDHRSLLG
ncbi:MAG: CoA-binding protein [Anaerolineales bacterium]|nr:CoA-binding protein [Anaerolineales bacterium]MBX3005575.1 CoA-binding protein [Anaerolineales bacterium]MCW5838542.1 CoA-binding protein [Anaerolineales bacterium]MCW5887542.1 CoA-binding protein [Anaerolineales bacterium]